MHEGRMAGRTGRAVARPARVARSHVPRVLLAAVALIVVLLQVGTAYALPGSELNGYPLGEILMNERLGNMRATCVYGASNNFFATLCLIGRKSDYLQLSPEQLSELSGEGTGGAFYELSLRWNNYALDGGPTVAENGYSAGFVFSIDGQSLISDPKYIWYGDYTYYENDSLYQRALDDYMTIYNGGHLGGGGSSGSNFVLTWVGGINNDTAYGKASTFTFDITLNDRLNDVVQRAKDDGYPYVTVFSSVYWYYDGSNMPGRAPTVVVSENPPVIGGSKVLSYTGKVIWYRGVYDTVNRDGNKITGTIGYDYAEGGNNWYVSWTSNDFFVGDGNSGGGGGGGGTWPEPDPPSPPKPPDVPGPDPYGPDIEPPNPYNPIVEPTPEPDPITDPYVVVVAPNSTDIIEWLRAILRAINNLGDKLNDESTELQNALNKVFFTNLSNLLKNLKGEFIQDYTSWLDKELEWLNAELHDYFVDLQNYLYKLFDWLADQMNFELNLNTDPYDDTSLLNWLRRIYNKLGADGGPNTRPRDPSTDEDGFLDWLRRMIQNFILDLGAAASDVVSDLGDLLSRLFAKFPFSVPWDLLAILGILDAPTMVPRLTFDIPLTFGTSTITWHVDIDLQAWSVYMEAVRTIILVSFISWLIWLTPQVLRDLDPGDFL